MNPTQVGNLIKSGLMALGVSSSVLAWVSNEVWIAIGGLVLTVGIAIWQIVSLRAAALIASVADEPVVEEVVLKDKVLAKAIPSPKVVALKGKPK